VHTNVRVYTIFLSQCFFDICGNIMRSLNGKIFIHLRMNLNGKGVSNFSCFKIVLCFYTRNDGNDTGNFLFRFGRQCNFEQFTNAWITEVPGYLYNKKANQYACDWIKNTPGGT
jgi:hypothetical protein